MPLALLFTGFSISASAQSQNEPVLHPINPAVIKVIEEDAKNWEPAKPVKTEPAKPEKETPKKPEKTPVEFRGPESPKYIRKGR